MPPRVGLPPRPVHDAGTVPTNRMTLGEPRARRQGNRPIFDKELTEDREIDARPATCRVLHERQAAEPEPWEGDYT